MRFDAVIFDLDGTLLETERIVVEAGLAAFRRMGLPERLDLLTAMVGTVGDDGTAAMRAAFGARFDRAVFDDHWQVEVDAAFAAGIPLRPGVPDLFVHLDALAMPRAVATNSRTEAARRNLATAGIVHHFDPAHIHGRDRVARPKPAPDLFLHAAHGLGADPARCLVFEDSDPGAAAALAAGMTVVLVPDQRAPGPVPVHHLADNLLAGARAAGLIA
jgi:HAD superfamily hydrolase (TIGR01509 family)